MFRLWNNVLQRIKGLTHFQLSKTNSKSVSYNNSKYEQFLKTRTKDNLQKETIKIQASPKGSRIQTVKTTLKHEEGTKILRNLGKTVAAATPTHPPLFSPWKSMYELSFHHSLSWLIHFSNLWAPWHIWDQLFTPMGYLLIFGKPSLCYIWFAPHAIESLMYSIYSVAYFIIGLAIVHSVNTI